MNPGSRFQLVLRLPGLEVAPSEQSITWQGRFEAAQFVVTAHKARSGENAIGTLLIVQDDIPIGSISFKIEIGEAAGNDRSRETGEANRYQEVFICMC